MRARDTPLFQVIFFSVGSQLLLKIFYVLTSSIVSSTSYSKRLWLRTMFQEVDSTYIVQKILGYNRVSFSQINDQNWVNCT